MYLRKHIPVFLGGLVMKKTIMMLLLAIASLSMLFAGGGSDAYPSRDVEVIVNAEAGGGTDTIVRKILSIVQNKHPDSNFYVTNNGATEANAPFEVMRAKPDGYTIGTMTYGSLVTSVYFNLIPQYDLSNLNMFCQITQESDAVMVRMDSPYQTFDDLIEAARQNPGKIRIGGANAGSRTSIVISEVEKAYGVDFNEVQYVGSATQREALLNGEVEAIITSLGDLAAVIASGQVRGLVEFSSVQNEAYPDVPPIAELGHPEIQCASFIFFCAPKDTPEDVINTLVEYFREAQSSDEFQDWIVNIGVTPVWREGEELKEYADTTQANAFASLDEMVENGTLTR